eukprot:TRINITY_DN10542_c0_g1_i1.p1 TRINITY_DN10542_c0_g1~~TRINITY_DN10542_c0_g1_i1.p1  ORF type:complete len:506 (-),score=60.11 TRINITY_DN10542_c0_g1_i1:315-1652(-)
MPSTMKEQLEKTYIKPWAPTSGVFQVDFLYGLFYSLYAWTNALVGSLFGGIIVDRYGTNFSTLLFCGLYITGQAIFALGSSLGSLGAESQYMVMVFGRFVFGMGGGAITLVQNTFSARYFGHDRMALAMGCTLTASRIGSVINLNVTATLVESTSIATVLWIGVLLCMFGGSFGVLLIYLDRKHQEYCKSRTGEMGAAPPVKKVTLRDITKQPAQLWILSCIISLYYIGIFAFIAVAKDFFQAKWHFDSTIHSGAAFRSSLVYLMSMVFTIFVGMFVDAVGRRTMIMFLTCACSIPSFLLFQFTSLDPLWGMLLLGATYMFAASSMWPCIPLVVSKELIGTANGVATSVQMIGIALANMVVGVLQDANLDIYPGTEVRSYSYCMVFFAGAGVLACLLSLVLSCLDSRAGGALSQGPSQAPADPNQMSLQRPPGSLADRPSEGSVS